METTFMSIHNLTPDANILFASESIVDILGVHPAEVTGRSCFDYFHPDEVPFAREVHSRGVRLDKAAVLHYARIRHRNGEWVGCECVFTIVYEVLVACTSIYRGDIKNARRAAEAPAIRRLFASSPRDPRYHMLEHLSSKFRAPPQPSLLEPRAALILNRFTRTLTVMYATNAISSILGISPEDFNGKSFYECMQENCLPEAIRCLESAKANDSIAYLRFWYRDPRREEDYDQEMREASQSSDSEDGGVELNAHMDYQPGNQVERSVVNSPGEEDHPMGAPSTLSRDKSRSSSDESTDLENDAFHVMFDQSQPRSSSSSLLRVTPEVRRRRRSPMRRPDLGPFELEAVVSCTSDGLVVILRRARPMIPTLQQPIQATNVNGLYAAPWGVNPILPHQYHPNQQQPFQHGLQAPYIQVGGPPMDEFMNSIREVAVFAWSLAGINGNIASYGHGIPSGEAQPSTGLPVWDPYGQPSPGYFPPQNQAMERWRQEGTRGMNMYFSSQTNEPNKPVPYTHARDEEHLRSHNDYKAAQPMGSDIWAAQDHAPINTQIAYVYQEHFANPLPVEGYNNDQGRSQLNVHGHNNDHGYNQFNVQGHNDDHGYNQFNVQGHNNDHGYNQFNLQDDGQQFNQINIQAHHNDQGHNDPWQGNEIMGTAFQSQNDAQSENLDAGPVAEETKGNRYLWY